MIIDRRVIRTTLGDDPEMIRECAGDFISTARADIKAIIDAVEVRNADTVRSRSHRLKGSAALFGAIDLKQTCAELESFASERNWELIRDLTPQLTTLMDEVEFAIENLLTQLSAK